MNWTQIELLKGIDLNDSFILNWKHEDNRLSFDLEASIWPESEYYTKPKKDEYTCYRKATLSFMGVNNIRGLKTLESVRFSTDASGKIDYGNIDSLQSTSTGFELDGDFGSVSISGGELNFEIRT